MQDLEFKAQMLKCIPALRAFAVSLVGKMDSADDLVQETLMKAWGHRDSFAEGTNFKAWLFTILRNEFYTHLRKRRREVEDADGKIAENVGVLPAQGVALDLSDMQTALNKLPPDQKEALLLVTASEMSYEEAAAICGVAVGTIKSRVNRARVRLSELLNAESAADFGQPDNIKAAIGASH